MSLVNASRSRAKSSRYHRLQGWFCAKFEMDQENTDMAIMTRFRSNYNTVEWNMNTRKLDAYTITGVQ